MFMVVKNNLKYLGLCVRNNIKTAAMYPVNFWIQVVFMMLNNGFFLIGWSVVFLINGGDINGVNMEDVMYLWSIPTIAFGVAYFLFGGVTTISQSMITGGFDVYMLQPKYPLITILTSKSIFAAVGDLLYGILMLLLATHFEIGKILIGLLLGIISSTIYLSMEIIIRSLSVWLGDTDLIAERYINTLLITLSTYPERIYPTVVKIIAYTIIPSAYMAFVPIHIVEFWDISSFIIFITAIFFFSGLAIFVFHKAIARYESGNQIAMKD